MNIVQKAEKATSPRPAAQKLFLALLAIGTASNAIARSRYGADLSGLAAEPFVGAGGSILGDTGLKAFSTGFLFNKRWTDNDGEEQVEPHTIDYSMRRRPTFGMALQPPSLGLDRSVGEIAEKQLRLAIMAAIPVGFMPWAFQHLNLSPGTKTGRKFAARTKARIAQRLATAVVNDALRNALDEKNRRGFPVVARKFPPSLRRGIWSAINVADVALGRARADLLEQAPILALVPDVVASGAGTSPKKILKAIGLPPLAAKIRPAALSTLARYKREHVDLSLTQLTGEMLTSAVLAAMDGATFRQRLLLALGLRLRNALSLQELEAVMVWFANASQALGATELRLHDLGLLADYLRAPSALAEQAGARPFNTEMAISTVIEQAETFAEGASKLKGGSTVPFPSLPWAPPSDPLPHSAWHLVRLNCERDLIVEGGAMGNCVAGYAGACLSGREAIYSIRRFTGTTGKKRVVRGATASFVRLPDGRVVIDQLRAAGNSRAVDSVRSALIGAGHTIIDG